MLALVVPASANAATTLIGSGSIGAEPVLRPLFKAYEKKTKGKVKFLYTPNGGNAGVADVQNGRSQFAGQARPPLPSDAGTIYIKLYLDGLCMFSHPSLKINSITKQQTKDIFTSTITNWGGHPRFGQDHDDQRLRSRHKWRGLQLLPAGDPRWRSAGTERQPAVR